MHRQAGGRRSSAYRRYRSAHRVARHGSRAAFRSADALARLSRARTLGLRDERGHASPRGVWHAQTTFASPPQNIIRAARPLLLHEIRHFARGEAVAEILAEIGGGVCTRATPPTHTARGGC